MNAPLAPSSEDELDNFVLFLHSEGELSLGDDDDVDDVSTTNSTVTPGVTAADSQVIDDLVVSADADFNADTFGQNNDLIAYNTVSLSNPTFSQLTYAAPSPPSPLQDKFARRADLRAAA